MPPALIWKPYMVYIGETRSDPGTSWVRPNDGSYIYDHSLCLHSPSQFPYLMLFASIQTLIFCFVSWITLKLFRRILARSSLDTLPSPPPTSLVFGESIYHFASIHLTVLGNIPELYHPEGWDFHRKILESCKYPFGEFHTFSRWLNRWNHYENKRRFRSMMPFIV